MDFKRQVCIACWHGVANGRKGVRPISPIDVQTRRVFRPLLLTLLWRRLPRSWSLLLGRPAMLWSHCVRRGARHAGKKGGERGVRTAQDPLLWVLRHVLRHMVWHLAHPWHRGHHLGHPIWLLHVWCPRVHIWSPWWVHLFQLEVSKQVSKLL